MKKVAKKPNKKESKIIEARQRMEKAAFLEKLKDTPLVQVACRKTGIGRSTYYRWIEEDEKFASDAKIALFQSTAITDDLAESKLIQAMQNGESWAIKFWLTHHKDEYKYKPETLKQFEDNADDARRRRDIRIMIEEVNRKFEMDGYKEPWQKNNKQEVQDDRKKNYPSPDPV